MKKNLLLYPVLGCLLVVELFFLSGTSGKVPPLKKIPLDASHFPELQTLNEKNSSFKELSKFFSNLAEVKGAEYAYQALLAATLPPNTDLHLLGHVVGDELFKQKGLEGINICTNDFRNACSHSIVVGLFLEQGEGALPKIAEACQNAPGGTGAYTMCFHGLGHGILAYTGYEMPKTIELCKKTGTPARNNREYIECVGGAVMEITGGGFHNPELWAKKSAEYAPKNNPLAPCDADYMPEEARAQCYLYLTPRLFTAFGGSLGYPTEKDFEQGFSFCARVTAPRDRDACFGGFGKDFIVHVQDRDIRKMELLTDTQLAKVKSLCELAHVQDGIKSCIMSALSSLYWGGENDYHVVLRFCGVMTDPALKDACFRGIVGAMDFYERNITTKESLCKDISEPYQLYCKETLLHETK